MPFRRSRLLLAAAILVCLGVVAGTSFAAGDRVEIFSRPIPGTLNGTDVAVDSSGAIYVTGTVNDPALFTATSGAWDATYNGNSDVFIAKISPDGQRVEYATLLGGTNTDEGISIAVDDQGRAVVTGRTNSSDFSTSSNALRQTYSCVGSAACWDAFVTVVSPDGSSLVYSTYLGGNTAYDYGMAVAVSGDQVYLGGITHYSSNFPTTPNAFRQAPCCVYPFGYAAKLDISLSGPNSLVYATAIAKPVEPSDPNPISSGATGTTYVLGIAAGADGSSYLVGQTNSSRFPLTTGSFASTYPTSSGLNGFVTKLNPDGSGLVYSTLLAGSAEDKAVDVAVDGDGSAYVTGFTKSADFPTRNPSQSLAGTSDAFATKLNPEGSDVLYSTYLGGSGSNEAGRGIAVNQARQVFVIGQTDSADFPGTSSAAGYRGAKDGFLAELSPVGELAWAAYLGGPSDDDGLSVAAGGTAIHLARNEGGSTIVSKLDEPAAAVFLPVKPNEGHGRGGSQTTESELVTSPPNTAAAGGGSAEPIGSAPSFTQTVPVSNPVTQAAPGAPGAGNSQAISKLVSGLQLSPPTPTTIPQAVPVPGQASPVPGTAPPFAPDFRPDPAPNYWMVGRQGFEPVGLGAGIVLLMGFLTVAGVSAGRGCFNNYKKVAYQTAL